MDSDVGKIFVGGISWETTEDVLKEHFSNYGEVVGTVIMKDRNTGNARGFGFVQFSDPSVVDVVLQQRHVVLGRTVEVKKAVPRSEQHQNQQNQHNHSYNRGFGRNSSNGGGGNNQYRTKKIFVGGLSATLTEEEFRAYFEKFGRITDVVVMYDSTTHRPRGFGFITFDTEEAVESVMQEKFHELNDKRVEVKKAVPKDGSNNGNHDNYNNNFNMRMGAGRGSIFGSCYPTYSPRYGLYTGYSPMSPYPYGSNAYGGYPIGGYGGIGFGAPMASPRSPWNGPPMVGPRRSPVPYGNGAFHPGYVNGFGGMMGMAPGGTMGPMYNGKWNQANNGDALMSTGTTPTRIDGGVAEDESAGLIGSYGAASGKQNQRGQDARFKPYLVGNSS